jgi:hypothetical protein
MKQKEGIRWKRAEEETRRQIPGTVQQTYNILKKLSGFPT